MMIRKRQEQERRKRIQGMVNRKNERVSGKRGEQKTMSREREKERWRWRKKIESLLKNSKENEKWQNEM